MDAETTSKPKTRQKDQQTGDQGMVLNVYDRGKFPGHHVLAGVRCGWTRMVVSVCKWVRNGDYTYLDIKASKNKVKRASRTCFTTCEHVEKNQEVTRMVMVN